MAAFTEVQEGVPRQVRLLNCDGFDDDVRSPEKSIALTACVWSDLTFNDDGKFNKVCGTHQTVVGTVDKLNVAGGFRFPKKDGGKGRGIQDQLGRPWSS